MSNPKRTAGRIHGFDVIRGFSVISMVLFHFCYDLKYIAGLDLKLFAPPEVDIWRASISWTFIFVAGCMCALSRDNLRRSCKYLLVAFLIFIVTSLARVDIPINFGVIYCMGACTLACWLLDQVHIRPRGYVAAIFLFAAFLVFLPVASGYLQLPTMRVPLPTGLYDSGVFAWAGFPGPSFSSGDYYPLLPYLLLYMSGWAASLRMKRKGYPTWLQHLHVRPLEFVGRHALGIYLLHQPVLLAITFLIVS